MTDPTSLERVDVAAWAKTGRSARGRSPLSAFARLEQEARAAGEAAREPVTWGVQTQLRSVLGGADQAWMELSLHAVVPLVCQRCLGSVHEVLEVQRWFRFVRDEATAEQEDEVCEEDVLALSKELNVLELMEDELLMSLPLVPMHEQCPQALPRAAVDEAFERATQDKANPFAVLAQIKKSGQ